MKGTIDIPSDDDDEGEDEDDEVVEKRMEESRIKVSMLTQWANVLLFVNQV